MKLNLIEKTIESASVSAARNTAAVDVTGCDSLAFIMTLSAPSSPNTATIQLSGSLDGTNYVLVGSTVSVAAAGSYALTLDRPPLKHYRVAYAIASGSYTSTLKVLAKGDKGE